jgi:DNA mismatch repair protein MutS
MLEDCRNNFLVAICETTEAFGLAALDVSTGEFKATTLSDADAFASLLAELVRLQPAECLLSAAFERDERWVEMKTCLSFHRTSCEAVSFSLDVAKSRLAKQFDIKTLESGHTPLALRAAGAVLDYLQSTHPPALLHITKLESYRSSEYMVLDPTTRRNLELVQTLRQGERRGSVLYELDKTVTSMGARLLRKWLEQPLMNIAGIGDRLDAVEELVQHADVRQRLRYVLNAMYDVERLLARLAYGTANARQLVALRSSLKCLSHLREALNGVKALRLRHLIDDCSDEAALVKLLDNAIVDNPPSTLKDGGYIRSGFHAHLDELIKTTECHEQWIVRLQARERQRTGIKSLKVRYNQVFGYYIEVSNANLKHVPARYRRKQTLTNGERFITADLKKRETAILHASERRSALEHELFDEIRAHIVGASEGLQRIAAAVAQLDTLAALAEVAVLHEYCRPTIVDDGRLEIHQGRHPVVEQGIKGFVPNDLRLDEADQRLLIITGPNMAGKSTYLRQVALISVLAQTGSFVPAEKARIGLVDRVFTRVGAVDDIAAGRSTFMVEMRETAHILHHATPRSLLILDEIGKGTSTFEGLSIAWSVALFIARRLGSRALFATHYHELTALETLCGGVKNFHMAVRETPDGIVFLRQIAPGGSNKSYGLHVACLAGLPEEVLAEAKTMLSYLERPDAEPLAGLKPSSSRPQQLQPDYLSNQLLAMDISATTPLQALTLLHRMQQEIRSMHRNGGVLAT